MEQLKTKGIVRILIVVILLTMIIWLLPTNMTEVNAAARPKAPRISSKGTVTWDCVYFGHYPQSSNGKGGFKNEPIKWRVLSVKGNDAFLLADKNLDGQPYNKKERAITWEKSTIRSWLNGYSSKSNKDGINYTTNNFINKAFTKREQKAIDMKTVMNAKNPHFQTPGGGNTKDKVFLLSIAEAKTLAYGFLSNYDNTRTRQAKNTGYAASRENYMSKEGSTDWWRLRSPGYYSDVAAGVTNDGCFDCERLSVSNSNGAIRPALHLNLSSNRWKRASTVTVSAKPNKVTITKVSSNQVQALEVIWEWEASSSGYQITAATDKEFKSNKKTISIKQFYNNEGTTLKGLKSGKTYYIKVRGYVKMGKHTIYGPYSKVKSAKVK